MGSQLAIVSDPGSAQRRVRRRLDVAVHLWGLCALKHALCQHDDDEVARGVDQPRRAQTTVPAIGTAVPDRLPERPRAAGEEIGDEASMAFCASVSWSLVIARTASADSTAPPPRSSMRANARRSSAVETRPAAPSPNAGG